MGYDNLASVTDTVTWNDKKRSTTISKTYQDYHRSLYLAMTLAPDTKLITISPFTTIVGYVGGFHFHWYPID